MRSDLKKILQKGYTKDSHGVRIIQTLEDNKQKEEADQASLPYFVKKSAYRSGLLTLLPVGDTRIKSTTILTTILTTTSSSERVSGV